MSELEGKLEKVISVGGRARRTLESLADSWGDWERRGNVGYKRTMDGVQVWKLVGPGDTKKSQWELCA